MKYLGQKNNNKDTENNIKQIKVKICISSSSLCPFVRQRFQALKEVPAVTTAVGKLFQHETQ